MSALLVFSAALLSIFYAFPSAAAFTFTFGTASECDNLPVTWTGGTPPFELLIIPVFGTPRNISIPDSAFNNGKGSFSFPLPIAKGEQIILTMSDATGFNTGGSSNVLTAQPSQGGSCNSTEPGVGFAFQLNAALQQCRPFVFSGYSGATQPVTIAAVIPGGNAIVLNPPVGPNSFSWTANVARGTSMIFMMTDSAGRQGGSSDIRMVGFSDDSTCINSQSPSSTTSPPSSTATGPSPNDSSTPSPTPSTPAGNGISIAAIAATVIGALLFLAVIITLGLFFLRKKRDGKPASSNTLRRHSRRIGSEIDLTYDPSQAPIVAPYGVPPPPSASLHPYTPNSSRPFDSNPFLDSSHPTSHPPPSQYQPPSSQYQSSSSQYQSSEYQTPLAYQHPGAYQPPSQQYPPHPNYPTPPPDPSILHNGEHSTSADSMSPAQRKAAMAGATTYKPSRFIVHTDADDVLLPPPNDDGVVELPPQYTERHGPLGVLKPASPGANAGQDPPSAPYSS